MNKAEMEHEIIDALSRRKQENDSYLSFVQSKVREKTEQQLKYVLSSIEKNTFLEACAGSGKTEVVGMKTAYEISKWSSENKGIAVLTFTNEATDTIKARVEKFSGLLSLYPHHIGTLSGFIHGYIAQKFGYKYSRHKNRSGDTSFRLIDKSIDVFNNHWLTKYELPYTNINSTRRYAYANQTYYDHKAKDIVIYQSENHKYTLKEYYESDKFQKFIEDYRKKRGNQNLLGYPYIREQIIKVKQSFLEDGFANFEDINNIAYKILKSAPELASLIVTRFPIIFIDECQDLSQIELDILEELRACGATLHFIGDLNQSIYNFKDANPEATKMYLTNFEKYFLTDNFRSCQSIVDTSNQILGITLPIRGMENDRLGERSVCYLEYNELSSVVQQYLDFLQEVGIPFDRAAVLVRQQTLKQDLETNIQASQHPVLDAIQLWICNTPMSCMLALELAGKHLQKLFGGAKTKRNYYCPNSIESVYNWRVFIKNFLVACSKCDDLVKIDNIDYSTWYKSFNQRYLSIVQDAYQSLIEYDNEPKDFSEVPKQIAPKGTAKRLIIPYNKTDISDFLPINTIHSVKGKDFESVMVVSSLRNSGSGHWKQWMKKELESARISYVANTRAKHSLVWAVHNLKKGEREMIESFGFKRIN